MDLPFSQACDNNKQVILDAIKPYLQEVEQVLEVGSGTGQHAVHFAAAMPHLRWCTGDLEPNHVGIGAWIDHSRLANVEPPIALNVKTFDWVNTQAEAIYSANAIHIMSWPAAIDFIQGAATALKTGGLLLLYGPYNYAGAYTSPSNAKFDQWLKMQHPDSAIRDFEAVNDLAINGGLRLIEDKPMPANNRLLVWKKFDPAHLVDDV